MNVQLEVEILDLTPMPAVVLARSVDRASLGAEIGSGIRRVRNAVTAARVPTVGAPFVRYLSYGEEFDIEIGLPLDGPHAVPTLRATILPGGSAASLWHVGSYTGLPAVFGHLRRWVEKNATPAGCPWERYWTAHSTESPRTQVVWPVRLP